MEFRSLMLFGLFVLAVTQCSEARHSMHRRETDDDIFAADEASDDDGTQNDEFDGERGPEAQNQPPAVQAVIATPPKTYEISAGDDVKLECNVEPENATVVVQWYKGNDLYFMNTIRIFPEKDIPRHSVSSDSKDLLIEKVEASDAGKYKCELLQDKPVSIEHELIVLSSPEIVRLTATNDGNVVEGNNLMLTCDVRGKPPPQIVWSKAGDSGNKRLGENDGQFTMNSVYMKNVKREHSGKYYCYAFNRVGNNQAEIEIHVAGKPKVHVHKAAINSAVNVEAVLQCTAHYDANPHIRWYKDGLLIEDSSSQYTVSTHGQHSNLTVIPTTDSDFGTFTCEAENNIGKHNRSIELVQRPVIEALSVEDGKLSWTVHSHQPLQEIIAQLHQLDATANGEWKQIDIPLPSYQQHKYEIIYDLNEQRLDSGKYQAIVKVKNDHSWSDNSEPIVFDIDIQPQYIQHASVYRGTATAIHTSILPTIFMYLLVRLL